MAQVPYSPVPDVGMSDQPTPGLRVSGGAIEGASGENVGKAMGRFGAVLEHSGDELFKTAMRLQEQKNEAEALEGDALLSREVGDLDTKFTSQEGRKPSDGLMDYTAEIDKLRKRIRDGLSSDAVRRKYDRNALKTQEIAVRRGATHAASQLRRWTIDQGNSSINIHLQRAYDNPNDDITESLNEVEKIVRRVGADQDKPPAKIEEEVRAHRSLVTASKIEGMSNEKPAVAQEMLNRAIRDQQLWGDKAKDLQKIITAKLDDVSTRNGAHEITANKDLTEREVIEAATTRADKEKPGDPAYRDSMVNRSVQQWRLETQAKRDDKNRAEDAVTEAILNPEVKTFDHLLQLNPGIEKTIKGTGPNYRREIQGKITRYQAALNKPGNDAEFGRVSAMRLNDPIQFAELDATKLPVSTDQMNAIGAWQRADRKKPHENAKVTQAQEWIKQAKGAELRALDIFSREKNVNDDKYDKYTWALGVAIDMWYDKHKKLPDRNEVINEIAPTLIDQEMQKGYLYPITGGLRVKTPALLNEEVPKAWEEELRSAVRAKHGKEMTPFEVGREWLIKRLKDVEKTKKKAEEGLP